MVDPVSSYAPLVEEEKFLKKLRVEERNENRYRLCDFHPEEPDDEEEDDDVEEE